MTKNGLATEFSNRLLQPSTFIIYLHITSQLEERLLGRDRFCVAEQNFMRAVETSRSCVGPNDVTNIVELWL